MTTRAKRDRQKENRARGGGHTGTNHVPSKRCQACQPTGPAPAPAAVVGKVSEWRGSGKQLLDLLPGVRTSKHSRGRTVAPRTPKNRNGSTVAVGWLDEAQRLTL
jgi:hypothetical protein